MDYSALVFPSCGILSMHWRDQTYILFVTVIALTTGTSFGPFRPI